MYLSDRVPCENICLMEKVSVCRLRCREGMVTIDNLADAVREVW